MGINHKQIQKRGVPRVVEANATTRLSSSIVFPERDQSWNRPDGYKRYLWETAHACVNYQELADWAQCVVDTRNAMAAVQVVPEKVWKA